MVYSSRSYLEGLTPTNCALLFFTGSGTNRVENKTTTTTTRSKRLCKNKVLFPSLGNCGLNIVEGDKYIVIKFRQSFLCLTIFPSPSVVDGKFLNVFKSWQNIYQMKEIFLRKKKSVMWIHLQPVAKSKRDQINKTVGRGEWVFVPSNNTSLQHTTNV